MTHKGKRIIAAVLLTPLVSLLAVASYQTPLVGIILFIGVTAVMGIIMLADIE